MAQRRTSYSGALDATRGGFGDATMDQGFVDPSQAPPLTGGHDEQQFGMGLTLGHGEDTQRRTSQAPMPGAAVQQPAPAFNLPKGVSVNESIDSDYSPLAPMAPTPTAGQMPQPIVAQGVDDDPGEMMKRLLEMYQQG